jgi:predicted membrane-bound spermidine synthase
MVGLIGAPHVFLFVLGHLTLATQIVLARELLASFGGTELLLSSYYCVWLCSLGTGAFVGRTRLAPRTLPTVAVILMFLPPWATLALRLSPVLPFVNPAEIAPWWLPHVSLLISSAPIGFVAGLLFPLTASQFSRDEHSAAKIGYLYMAEAGGSLVAGLVASFVLLDKADSFVVLLPFTGVFGAGLLYLLRSQPSPRPLLIRAMLLLALLHSLAWSGFSAITEEMRWSRISGGIELAWSGESKYGHVQIGRVDGRYSVYSNGNLLFSCPPDPLELAEVMVMLSLPRRIERIAIVGHPAPALLQTAPESATVTILQEDEKLTRAVASLCEADGRARDHTDARLWLGKNTEPLDLLVVYVPLPITAAANRYYTTDFLELAARNLSSQGVLAIPAHFPAALHSPDRIAAAQGVYHGLQSVFESVLVSPGPGGWFFASVDPALTLASIRERVSIDSPHGRRLHAYLELLFPDPRAAELAELLATGAPTPVNTDARPLGYIQHLTIWQKLSGQSGIFGMLVSRTAQKGFLILLLAATFLWAAWRQKSVSWYAGGVIGGTGFITLSAALLLMLGFQHVAGSLYNRIAALSGCYMAGLSVGAYLGSKRAYDLKLIDAALGILLLVCSFAIPSSRFPLLYYCLTFLLASIAGLQFPSATALMVARGAQPRRAAGFLDALDHVGAAVGALAACLLLLPLAGFRGAFLALAGFKLLAVLAALRMKSDGLSRTSVDTRSTGGTSC